MRVISLVDSIQRCSWKPGLLLDRFFFSLNPIEERMEGAREREKEREREREREKSTDVRES